MRGGLEHFNKPPNDIDMIPVGIDPNNPKAVVSLPLKDLQSVIDMYLGCTPKELVEHIEEQFILCKSQKVSRTSTTWGVWSASLNRATKQRVASKDPHSDKLELIHQYWQIISQLLQLYFKKSTWFGGAKIKQKWRQAKEIRRLIV